jgi:2-oxoglutarate dehydrogenase E1 component
MLESTPLYGGNADYLEGLYEQYLSDPVSVPAQWRTYFDGFGPRPLAEPAHAAVIAGIAARASQAPLLAPAASRPPSRVSSRSGRTAVI